MKFYDLKTMCIFLGDFSNNPYYLLKEGGEYIDALMCASVEMMEKIKKDYSLGLSENKIIKKYKISYLHFKNIKKAFNLQREPKKEKILISKPKKLNKNYMQIVKDLKTKGLTENDIFKMCTCMTKKMIKKGYKDEVKPFRDLVNIEEFTKDYIGYMLTNDELARKYKCSYVTLWLFAKELNIKRPPREERHKNIIKEILITKEEKNFLKQYSENKYLSFEWLIDKTGLNRETIKVRFKILGLDVLKREQRPVKLSKRKRKKIRRDFLYLDKGELKKKYNINVRDFKYFRPRKSIRNNLKLYMSGFLKCSKCGEIKKIAHFHTVKEKNIIKYRSECKDCKKIAAWKNAGIKGEPTTEELKLMKGYFNGRCAYCGAKIKEGEHTLDHIVSRAKGGTSNIDNIVIACFRCNTEKYTNSLEEFKDRKEYFTDENYKNIVNYVINFCSV